MNRRTQGIALVFTLGIMVVVAVLVFGAMYIASLGRFATRNDLSVTQSEYAAKAGLQQYKTAAFEAFRYYLYNPGAYTKDTAKYAVCGNLLSIGVDIDRNGVIDDSDLLDSNKNPTHAGVSGNVDPHDASLGQFNVRMYVDGATIMLESQGKARGAQAIMSTVLQAQNSGIFSQALSAGTGVNSKFINGNAQVYGSIYIEGNKSSPDTTVLDANGSFGVHNYYDEAALMNATDIKTEGGLDWLNLRAHNQKTMCAKIRVPYGRVKFSGSATAGDDPATAPSGYAAELDAVQVGNEAADVTPNSDDKWFVESTGTFDLDPVPSFPSLDANVTCSVTGQLTWAQCMQANAAATGMVIGYSPALTTSGSKSTVVAGTPTIVPSTSTCNLSSAVANVSAQEFDPELQNNTLPDQPAIVFGASSFSCLDSSGTRGFEYVYDPNTDTGTLTIKGQLALTGINLKFSQNVAVRYTEKSSIFVEKNSDGYGGGINVSGSVLPGESFPDKNVIGLIARDNLVFSGGTQNIDDATTKRQVSAGIFYAGRTLNMLSGPAVLGTVMGNSIRTTNGQNGSQAQIVQVPGLEFNLPTGFDQISAQNVPTFEVLAYERR